MPKQEIVYGCPCCGQGGLQRVVVKAAERKPAYVCEECDRIWLEPIKLGLHNGRALNEVMPELNLTDDWDHLEEVEAGVPWDALDDEFKALLERKGEAG